jgi:hypothetical protein
MKEKLRCVYISSDDQHCICEYKYKYTVYLAVNSVEDIHFSIWSKIKVAVARLSKIKWPKAVQLISQYLNPNSVTFELYTS